MYLFTRTARLARGDIRGSLAWAADMTERVNRIGVLEAHLWSSTLSPGLGTVTWAAFVPDLVTLETAQAKLESDDAYLDAVDAGASFLAPGSTVDDTVATIVHGVPDPAKRPEYVSVVTATLTPGSLRAGVELGVELADRATALAGAATTFCLATTGTFGAVAWFTGYPSIEALEVGEQAVNTDEAFSELLDSRAATVYVDGAASVLRRVV